MRLHAFPHAIPHQPAVIGRLRPHTAAAVTSFPRMKSAAASRSSGKSCVISSGACPRPPQWPQRSQDCASGLLGR